MRKVPVGRGVAYRTKEELQISSAVQYSHPAEIKNLLWDGHLCVCPLLFCQRYFVRFGMNSLFAKFRNSASELSNVRSLSTCAMMLALRVVVGYFANFSLAVTPNAKVGFAFLPVALASIICGPVCGMIVGGLGDIISFLLVPMGGGYFFGWTLSGMLVGMLYGIFLYKNDCTLIKLIICEVIIAVFIEIALGSLWLKIQFGNAFWVMTATRSVKALISLPIETALVYFFAKFIKKVPFLNRK